MGVFIPWLGLGKEYTLISYEILTELPDVIKTLKNVQMHQASSALNLMMASIVVYLISIIPMVFAIRYRFSFSIAIILLLSAGVIFHISVNRFKDALGGWGVHRRDGSDGYPDVELFIPTLCCGSLGCYRILYRRRRGRGIMTTQERFSVRYVFRKGGINGHYTQVFRKIIFEHLLFRIPMYIY